MVTGKIVEARQGVQYIHVSFDGDSCKSYNGKFAPQIVARLADVQIPNPCVGDIVKFDVVTSKDGSSRKAVGVVAA